LAETPIPGVGRPPGSDDVLAAIRGEPATRRQVDPGLAGGLREWLEDGLSSFSAGSPVVVTKQKMRDALSDRPRRADDHAITVAMALGALMDALFRQFVTTGRIEDPIREALAALEIDDRRSELVRFVRALSPDALAGLGDEVETQCAILVSRWPRLAPAWMPRTQESIAIPLAGGEVVLIGVIDLLIGSPSTGRSSTGIVDAKSGQPRLVDREDLHFYALLETLRSGAAPFRVATFYTRTGEIDAEDVTDDMLTSSVRRVLAAVERMGEGVR